jgi:drug/metabolite transporter (DMT)-like permease|tara:strand:- start:1259 stop:2146 length:888 start_codon:yes stop_codon:yes gene_type:complete
MINNIKKGIFIIILATFFFSIMDGVSRYLAETYNVFVINMLRSWVLVLIVISISLRKKNGLRQVAKTSQPLLQITRGILLISAICIGVYSFTKLGLVQTHSILSCYPLIVVALSGPILKEKIGIQRWLAVLFGFFGVLIILDPSTFIITFDAILPLLGALILGSYTILTRKASEKDSSETSFFWVAIIGCIVMTFIGPFYWEPIFIQDWGWLALLCILSTTGHFLFIKAFENAEASVLQPFTYLQLFFASIIGIFIFNDQITLPILIGGALVVGSGIFAAWRNHKNNQSTLTSKI